MSLAHVFGERLLLAPVQFDPLPKTPGQFTLRRGSSRLRQHLALLAERVGLDDEDAGLGLCPFDVDQL
jgi:hypothetical protein